MYMLSPTLYLSFVYYSYLMYIFLLYVYTVGEFGLVYKGYIDTPLGSELVAVKTGKGIRTKTVQT